MGNRAVITTAEKRVGVYLHWNGGRDSVTAFLTYCDRKGYPSPDKDSYGWARLCQVIGNFFGGTNSLGMDDIYRLDYKNHDNGLYMVEGWKIISRQYNEHPEQYQYNLEEMIEAIDAKQPENERLTPVEKAKYKPAASSLN